MKHGRFSRLQWRKAAPTLALSEALEAALPATLEKTLEWIGDRAVLEAVREYGMPETPTPMAPADECRYLLQAAAEIEQSLMVQYLFAGNSMAPGMWRNTITGIAVEEMGHLITVQNLIISLGGQTHMDRENISYEEEPAGDYSFPPSLEKLSKEAVAKYVTTESPLPDEITDAGIRAEALAIAQVAQDAAHRPVRHVGLLFAKLFWLLQPDDNPHPIWPLPPKPFHGIGHVPDEAFQFDAALRQADGSEIFGPPGFIVGKVLSREDALRLVYQIASQGEGPTTDSNSHFWRFLLAYRAYDAEIGPGIAPVATNPSTLGGPGRINAARTLAWAKLLNVRYELILLRLLLALQQRRDTPDQTPLGRPQLISAAIYTEMDIGVKPVAARLAQLPIAEGSAEMAGPPYELPAAALPGTDTAIKQRMEELLTESASQIKALREFTAADAPTADDQSTLGAIEAADQELRDALEA
ncbi:ferritin-like domain-containing protein [uncultured Paludibaculum sp.]|uniref:ferritin-like domain-containing protein n=1 Tax=uncultured Paludibaculum sp. TaxID=1765020 RepID=UPI002AAA8840|nr:ferritin-like domain-containing protein [uncultured Paludibaculum sp.]